MDGIFSLGLGFETESDELNIRQEVLAIIDEALSLGGRGRDFTLDTPLLGAVPELDSMAVVGVLNLLEERFAFIVDDDEIDGSAFASVGTLVAFVEGKLG
jgi:acyl carrier protein